MLFCLVSIWYKRFLQVCCLAVLWHLTSMKKDLFTLSLVNSMLTSSFPVRPHKITLSKKYNIPYVMTFYLLQSRKVISVRLSTQSVAWRLRCNFNDMNNHWWQDSDHWFLVLYLMWAEQNIEIFYFLLFSPGVWVCICCCTRAQKEEK